MEIALSLNERDCLGFLVAALTMASSLMALGSFLALRVRIASVRMMGVDMMGTKMQNIPYLKRREI